MKFTNLQQKWTLTTGLMIALGFSFSMHFSPKSGPEYAQLGAAQEQIEPVMLAQDKKLQVTHMSSENKLPPPPTVVDKKEEAKKTEANVFPVWINRESEMQQIKFETSDQAGKTKVTFPVCKVEATQKNQNCPTGTCGTKSQLMDVDMNSGISELVNVFAATYGKCATEEAKTASPVTTPANNAEVKSSTTTTVAATEVSEEDKHKAVFDKVRAKCDKESKESRIDCRINELTKLLSDSKVVYTKSVVLDFFKTQIEEPMKNSLGSYDYTNPFAQHEYVEKTRDLANKIKEMQEEIGSSYSYLRERIANMSVRAIAEKALEVNTYRHTGQVGLESAALGQLQIMNQLLPASNRIGLMSAMSNEMVKLNPLYASNMYSSVGSLGNNIFNNISRIADMDSYSAQSLLTTGLIGLDSWNYQRGALTSLDLVPQLHRLGIDDGSILLSDRLSGRGRRGNVFDRGGLFGSGRLGLNDSSMGSRRGGRRGTGGSLSSSFFRNDSGVIGNRLGLSTDGLLGQPQVYQTGFSAVGNNYLPQTQRSVLSGSRLMRGNRF